MLVDTGQRRFNQFLLAGVLMNAAFILFVMRWPVRQGTLEA